MSIIDNILNRFKGRKPANAIDDESDAVDAIMDWLTANNYTFADQSALEHLSVLVCMTEHGLRQPWAGDSFMRALKNRFAAHRINAEPDLIHIEKAPEKEDGPSVEIIPGTVYLSFGRQRQQAHNSRTLKLVLEEGTGSARFNEYVLEPTMRQYCLGRGRLTETGARQDRIIILEDDPDSRLQDANRHVSVNQVIIYPENGRWLMVRCADSAIVKYESPDYRPASRITLPQNGTLELQPDMRLYFGSRGVCFIVESAE